MHMHMYMYLLFKIADGSMLLQTALLCLLEYNVFHILISFNLVVVKTDIHYLHLTNRETKIFLFFNLSRMMI